MSRRPVDLRPIAGFCIKSSTLQPGVYTPIPIPQQAPNTLEPVNAPLPIPKGLKVFINIAWDINVPPPPEGGEDAIQRAMLGEEIDDLDPDGWYVPVVVSEPRQDKDKAGSNSLVFDCVYNSAVKSRTLRDPEFKIFIVELALQRIEAQTSLVLSRQIGTPNIASKGKLLPRTVFIPTLLSRDAPKQLPTVTSPPSLSSPINSVSSPSQARPLIQEISPNPSQTPAKLTPAPPLRQPKGILKPTSSIAKSTTPKLGTKPTWAWVKHGHHIRVTISVPSLTHALVPLTILDVEARRIILRIPDHPVLDINLDLSDAEIVSAAATSVTSGNIQGESAIEPANTLTLKRQRDLDVDGATAEWRVTEGVLEIVV